MQRIRAITFDLDDTLWPATPTLQRAEQRAHAWLTANAPAVASRWPIDRLRELRMSFYHARPDLHHNLLHIRRLALQEAFAQTGLTGNEALELIDQALAVFMTARNDVELFPDVHGCLARLSQRYALASLTNGNASVTAIGLGPYFKAIVAPHTHGALKPDLAIFHMACRELDCEPGEVLHVGDDPDLDIRGARGAGLHAVWMNRNGIEWMNEDAPVTVRSLLELEHWLEQG